MSTGQTGHKPGGVPPKFFMFIVFFFPQKMGEKIEKWPQARNGPNMAAEMEKWPKTGQESIFGVHFAHFDCHFSAISGLWPFSIFFPIFLGKICSLQAGGRNYYKIIPRNNYFCNMFVIFFWPNEERLCMNYKMNGL